MLPNNALSWKKFVVKPPWRSYGYQFKNENGFLRDLGNLNAFFQLFFKSSIFTLVARFRTENESNF